LLRLPFLILSQPPAPAITKNKIVINNPVLHIEVPPIREANDYLSVALCINRRKTGENGDIIMFLLSGFLLVLGRRERVISPSSLTAEKGSFSRQYYKKRM